MLIIGGGTGIGAAVASRMAGDGYSVCVSGRRRGPIEEVASAVSGLAVSADASTPSGAERAVEACVERFGGLDALVISAGAGAGAMVAEQTLERWNLVIATNLTAPFLVSRAALPHLIEARGAIVTISSLAGLRADPAVRGLLQFEGRSRDAHAVHRARLRAARGARQYRVPGLDPNGDG